jgi:cytochrome c oxidase assembly factor CtaG
MILLAMGVVGMALGVYEKFGTRQRQDFQPITGQEGYWFVFGTLMQEGTEVSPVTVAGNWKTQQQITVN